MSATGIRDALRAAGIEASLEQARLLESHARAVCEANQRINLTSVEDEAAFVELHIVDSLMPIEFVRAAAPGAMIDIGTGGGYPGLPLAIVADRPCVLLDATRKKAAFLEETVKRLALGHVMVVAERSEEYAEGHRGEFAVAVARAVGELATVIELATPLLNLGGCLIAYKGRLSEDELARGDSAARLCGLRRVAYEKYALPSGQQRSIAVFERVGEATVAVPRRPGMAAKRPLG